MMMTCYVKRKVMGLYVNENYECHTLLKRHESRWSILIYDIFRRRENLVLKSLSQNILIILKICFCQRDSMLLKYRKTLFIKNDIVNE